MGLGKKKGSSRINRYEHQVTAIGFDNLAHLAKALNVPAAYLLADTPGMAEAILALAEMSEDERVGFANNISSDSTQRCKQSPAEG